MTGDNELCSCDVSLRDVFPQARFVSTNDIVARRCSCNALASRVGDVLVVGLDDVPADEAAARGMAAGVSAVVTEQLLPVPVPQCIVPDARVAYAELVSQLAGNPSQKVLSIGVAGLHGKTSTTLLVAAAMRKAGLRVAYNCDLGISDGIVQQVPRERSSDAQTLTTWYADARDAECQVAIIELSDLAVRTHQVDGTSFDVLILSGDADHDRIQSDQGSTAYDSAIGLVRNDGVVIVNEANRHAMSAVARSGVSSLTYGFSDEADVSGRIIERHQGESTLVITAGDTSAAVTTKLTGDWMVAHQLAATAATLLLDLPLQAITKGLTSLDRIPGRMQSVPSFTGPRIVIDSASAPERILGTMNSIRKEPGGGRVWCIAACHSRMASEEAANLGYLAERCSDHLVLTSDHTGADNFLPHVHNVMDGIVDAAQPQLVANRKTAIQWTISKASPRDTIVILGGWASDSPHSERAGIDADIRMAEAALEGRENHPIGSPTILPHPSMLKTV